MFIILLTRKQKHDTVYWFQGNNDKYFKEEFNV